MVGPGLTLAHTLVLQTAQGGQHIDRRGNALAEQLPAQDDLALSDISRQVGDGVGLVILGHGEDGDHGDRPRLAHLPPRPLIHSGQVGIEIARVATAARDLLFGGRHLTEGLSVVGNVGKDDQHVHVLFKGQVLRRRQGHTGGGNALHGGVVGQIGKEHRAVNGTGALELLHKEIGFLKGDTDGGKDHGKVGPLVAQHLSLTGDLGRQGGVGQARAGEDGQLLPTDQGIQPVDGGDAGLDELVGVVPGGGVHGQAVDVPVFVGKNVGSAIDRLSHTVEDPAQHLPGHPQLQGMAQKTHLGLGQVDTGGGFKELDHGGIAVDLQHLAVAHLAARQLDLAQLVIGDALDAPDHHQRAVDLLDRFIFPDHSSSPPFSTAMRICSAISSAMSA